MQQAMRSTGFKEGKDGFKRATTARMQLAHQLRHMGFSASTDKALQEPVSDDFGLPQAAAWALAKSAPAAKAFCEALSKGTLRPRTLKAMFVGQGRAGKTSTLKALTGQRFQEQEPSTHGLSTATPLVQTEAVLDVQSSFVSQWQLVDRSEHEIHGAELEKTCAAYVAERLAQRRAPLAAAAAPSPDGERPEGGDAGEEEEQEKLELATRKMRVDLVAKMIQGEEESEPPVMLKTWDFGGQREYYVMHHLFLTNRGFYIVVTRLDAWLNGPLDDDAGHLRFGQEDDGAFEPPLDALTFWLSSIHVHAPDALVFIVGSHADVVANHPDAEASDWRAQGDARYATMRHGPNGEPFQFSDELPDAKDLDAWATIIPVASLPPLPPRDPSFCSESATGLAIVAAVIVSLVGSVHLSLGPPSSWQMPLWCASADLVIRGLALLGSVCTLLILFGRFGEVKRSKKTCYPIPAQVVHQLRCAPEAARPQLPARNIAGPPGHTLGSYCIRCFLWRSTSGRMEGGWRACRLARIHPRGTREL
ncbi:Probable serine/threonine-protein kinase pats1 (Protein associated with the transduction of signal 1), partial [Durusdinium trenchii]